MLRTLRDNKEIVKKKPRTVADRSRERLASSEKPGAER